MPIITELNELIYAGVILACDKIGIAQKNTNRNSKSEWEIKLKTLASKNRKTNKTKSWNMLR